jgi:predicted nucleic acid-binding protein
VHPEVVIDASVWLSRILTRDSNPQPSYLWSETFIGNGGILVAPELLLVEVAAVMTRDTGQPALATYTVRGLYTYASMRVVPFETSLVQQAIDVAANLRLRAGDAFYVALAHQLGIPLVSWDNQQLQRAASVIETYTPTNYPFPQMAT